MIRVGDPRHRIQTQVLPAPFNLLVVLVFHAAQGRRLLLSQLMPLPQFAEALSEKFGSGKVVRHLCRLPILRENEHRSINSPCLAAISGLESRPL